jgi:hypothetical protein
VLGRHDRRWGKGEEGLGRRFNLTTIRCSWLNISHRIDAMLGSSTSRYNCLNTLRLLTKIVTDETSLLPSFPPCPFPRSFPFVSLLLLLLPILCLSSPSLASPSSLPPSISLNTTSPLFSLHNLPARADSPSSSDSPSLEDYECRPFGECEPCPRHQVR